MWATAAYFYAYFFIIICANVSGENHKFIEDQRFNCANLGQTERMRTKETMSEGCGAADPDNYVDCDNVDVNDNHYYVVIKTKENYCGNCFTQIPCIKHFQINFHYTRMTVAFVRSNVKGMKHKTFENVFHSRQSQSPGS